MPKQFQRPSIPFVAENLRNNDRYQLAANRNQPISADMLDGDINYAIQSINETYDFAEGIAEGILPGSTSGNSVGKFPVTNGQDPADITWSKVFPIHLSAQCISPAALQDSCVTEDALATASISSEKLQYDAVDNSVIEDGAISFNKITAENNTNFATFWNSQDDDTLNIDPIIFTEGSLDGDLITTNTLPASAIISDSITRDQLSPVIKMPIGIMMDWAPGGAAPAGWLLASGQSLATAAYPALFAAIGYIYGGAGANFNIPDTRGRVTASIDPTSESPTGGLIVNNTPVLGGVGGLETHTLTIPQIPSHSHTYKSFHFGNPIVVGSGSSEVLADVGTDTGLTGGGLPHNNMQPYILMPKIIYAGV